MRIIRTTTIALVLVFGVNLVGALGSDLKTLAEQKSAELSMQIDAAADTGDCALWQNQQIQQDLNELWAEIQNHRATVGMPHELWAEYALLLTYPTPTLLGNSVQWDLDVARNRLGAAATLLNLARSRYNAAEVHYDLGEYYEAVVDLNQGLNYVSLAQQLVDAAITQNGIAEHKLGNLWTRWTEYLESLQEQDEQPPEPSDPGAGS